MIEILDRAKAAWRALRGDPPDVIASIPEDAASAQPGVPFMLGGRAFRLVDFDRRTVLIDHYLMRIIRQLGLDKVMPMDGEDNRAYFVRLQAAIFDSGRAQDLIAGFILPVDITERQWTPEIARASAKHIAHCDTEADRTLVMELATEAVFAFFAQGVEWLTRSLAYSQAMEAAAVAAPTRMH